MPTLHVLQGPDKGRIYTTPDEPAVIGRSSEHIQLSDHGTSRRHAEIYPENGHWVLLDLGSSNGTYLNGQRIFAPAHLKYGDQIKVGSTLLVFTGQEEVRTFTGAQSIRDLVDLAPENPSGGSSILAAVNASEDSIILQPPETADAVAAWNVVYKIAEAVSANDNVESFLERVADIIFEHLSVDHLIMMTAAPDLDHLEPRIVRCRTSEPEARPRIVTSRTIINHVVNHRDGVLCANALTDDRFPSADNHDSLHELGPRSIICVPILARDRILGVIHLDCAMARHTYTPEQLRLAVAIGRLSGMAIENARLQESRLRTERLAAAGETVAYLSHHIRNLLQGMQGGADVLELGLRKADLDTLRSGWNLVRRNLDRVFELTMNMLTFSKDRRPRREHTEISRIVADALALAQHRADDKGVMLLSDLIPVPSVEVDPEGVHQVVHNIILNAIDAVPERTGRVTIQTRYHPESGEVLIAVADNGPGIREELRESIFEPFQSAKGHGGTGLGLAAARKIINELHGRIEITGNPGEGAIFTVGIPVQRVRLDDNDVALSGGAATH